MALSLRGLLIPPRRQAMSTTPEEPEGWYNEETGQWDKDEPDLPAFMEEK